LFFSSWVKPLWPMATILILFIHFIDKLYQFYTSYIKTHVFAPGNAGSPFWTFCSTFPRTILLLMLYYHGHSRYVGYRYVIWINVLKFEVTGSSESWMIRDDSL
jgi:hypothetical protein